MSTVLGMLEIVASVLLPSLEYRNSEVTHYVLKMGQWKDFRHYHIRSDEVLCVLVRRNIATEHTGNGESTLLPDK